MLVHFETPEERRNMRIRLYKDDVFLLAQEAIGKLKLSVSMEDLFASADCFTDFLLTNDISERYTMQFEIDDLRAEVSDGPTFYALLALSYLKLCALRKGRPNAVQVARVLVGFCQEYDGFTDFLEQVLKKEIDRGNENKWPDLQAYRLRCIETGKPVPDGQTLVSMVVDTASEGLSADGILPVEAVLSEVDRKIAGHPFKDHLERLSEARKKKSVSKIEIDRVNDIHDNPNVNLSMPK